MSRPQKCRRICSKPRAVSFVPVGTPAAETVVLGFDEYETLRLIDYEGYSQAQCAQRMDVARTTVTRMYASARQKMADALVNGRRLEIAGGDVVVCAAPRPECRDAVHCCHRMNALIPKAADHQNGHHLYRS